MATIRYIAFELGLAPSPQNSTRSILGHLIVRADDLARRSDVSALCLMDLLAKPYATACSQHRCRFLAPLWRIVRGLWE